MNRIQNQIKRTLAQPESIGYVRGLLEINAVAHRTELAGPVCERFGFYDARGRAQLAGCLKALRELERGGHFSLPAAYTPPKRKPSPRRLSEAVAEPRGMPAEVGAVRGLELIRVKTSEQMRLWNELMASEHPQGAGPLVGRQLRYLIGSAHGGLGGVGFAAPALQLADRDAGRLAGTPRRAGPVSALWGRQASRFLLRPSVACRNLASKVLSLSLLALPDDFERRYGYRPWLGQKVLSTAIGGYLGRNHNPPPGHQLLWQGYTEFQFMCLGFTLPAKT